MNVTLRIAIDKTAEEALALQHKGLLDDAERLFRVVHAADSANFVALYSLSVILVNKGLHSEALPYIDSAIKIHPNLELVWHVRGSILSALRCYQEALTSFDRALLLKPDHIESLINQANLLYEMKKHQEALTCFKQVLAIQPDNVFALDNSGVILSSLCRHEEAIAMFEKLLTVNPDFNYGLGSLCYTKLHCCNWRKFELSVKQIIDGVQKGKRACKGLAFMAISNSAADQLICARTYATHKSPRLFPTVWQGELYDHDRIRVAYVSADLRQHPVAHLLVGVLERHDTSRFEVIAVSLGVNDKSQLRNRIERASSQFIEAENKTALTIAKLLRSLEVDIAIDLAGYTASSRTDIFAHRAAPLQVNYLGYPGSMGTDYMDYIIADKYVIPEEDQSCYCEKVLYLPDTYLPTDAGLQVSAKTPSRKEAGLPEEGFVFCAFNHDYKITPAVFNVWMRILGKIEGSVLWLMKLNEPIQRNLRREAEARGINPQRLIFAARVPCVEDHLARYRLAGVFLDTTPYNGHTTVSDALKAGLPVLTCAGKTFPARVAGSLLHAVGLPEMITYSLEDYEALAIKLARDNALLTKIKARLAENSETYPLFDTDRYCQNIEKAFEVMVDRYKKGENPACFSVCN